MPASFYHAPLQDMRFVLHEVAGFEALLKLVPYQSFTPELGDAVLEEAAKFASEVLSPINASGDEVGSKHNGKGEVTTPLGFKAAYQQFIEGGWNAAPISADHGGQGLPTLLSTLVAEMWHGSNMSFGLCPMLTQSAIELIARHAPQDLKSYYLPKLVSGEWTGTMCMTEPEAGSDVGAIRTQATPAGDGSYKIKGTKIFITYGEHDFTDNIVHMVLARLPGAPAGIKGVSLFLVPKFLKDGSRNDLVCVSLEHKMGINASPTAVMSFGEQGGAIGWLVGEAGRGINAMFTMMNSARLAVGLEGVGVAAYAYQLAEAYAASRIQGKDLKGNTAPIAAHADVQRMLLTMRSHGEALRALAAYAGALSDQARYGENQAAAQARLDILIPIVKGHGTDQASAITSLAVQVFGGLGFIEETGVSQLMRDVRVAMIYEGTNGIQAADLAMRKIHLEETAVRALLIDIEKCAEAATQSKEPKLVTIGKSLLESTQHLRRTTAYLQDQHKAKAQALLGMASTPYLALFGLVAEGYMLTLSALQAHRLAAQNSPNYPKEFLAQKTATAHFFALDQLACTEAFEMRVMRAGELI